MPGPIRKILRQRLEDRLVEDVVAKVGEQHRENVTKEVKDLLEEKSILDYLKEFDWAGLVEFVLKIVKLFI